MSDENNHLQRTPPHRSASECEPVNEITGEESIVQEQVKEYSEDRILGRYRLCFELATGGMAKVYLARAQGPAGFEKLVALKQIHEHLSSREDVVEMFLDEAKVAARIDHANVCSVFDFGLTDGTYYLAMEYLAGETLTRIIKKIHFETELSKSPMLPVLAARVFADACEGLHAAHELRDDSGKLVHLVHRDVSPTNLFVTYDGSVKLMDFGVAKMADRIQTTMDGQVKGKFAYLAPERLKANRVTLDRRADIWSMGVVLWEFLAGRRLFQRKGHAETVQAVIRCNVPPPSKLNPRVPQELDEIVMSALQPDREQRCETARELGRALDKFNSTQPSSALAADVAELMERLFPAERAKKQQMIELARQMGDDTVLKIDAGRTGTAGTGSSGSRSRDTASIPPIDIDTGTADEVVLQRTWPPRAFWVAIILLGIALALSLFLVFQNGDEAAEAEVAENHSPPVASLGPGEASPPFSASDVALPPVEPAEPLSDAAGGTPSSNRSGPSSSGESSGANESAANVLLAKRATKTNPDGKQQKRRPRGPPGSVVAVTPGGWADVYLGSKRLGRTPARLTLPPGTHVLRFLPFGKRPALAKRVTVPPGGSARVVVRLAE